jgi:hypothetical protein
LNDSGKANGKQQQQPAVEEINQTANRNRSKSPNVKLDLRSQSPPPQESSPMMQSSKDLIMQDQSVSFDSYKYR